MTRAVQEHEVSNWKQFVLQMDELLVGSPLERAYLFRGQASADWPLVPSLVRRAREAHLNPRQALKVEAAAVMDFQTQAHLHLPTGAVPDKDDVISWWTLMQDRKSVV